MIVNGDYMNLQVMGNPANKEGATIAMSTQTGLASMWTIEDVQPYNEEYNFQFFRLRSALHSEPFYASLDNRGTKDFGLHLSSVKDNFSLLKFQSEMNDFKLIPYDSLNGQHDWLRVCFSVHLNRASSLSFCCFGPSG